MSKPAVTADDIRWAREAKPTVEYSVGHSEGNMLRITFVLNNGKQYMYVGAFADVGCEVAWSDVVEVD